jgi:hypothetical protein
VHFSLLMLSKCFCGFCESEKLTRRETWFEAGDCAPPEIFYLRLAAAVIFYLWVYSCTCSYLSLFATSCSYLSLHVTQVKSIQMWTQVTISFWICNPQFQLFTCNGVQSLSRKTNSVQEWQYRNNQKIVLALIKKDIRNNWNLYAF